jgi:hypothetical protein
MERNHRGQQTNFIEWEEVEQAKAAVFTSAKLLPTPKEADARHRRKRGLINVGDALKFLFGVATTQQLQDLHTTVENPG